jgi:hypothetical protein
MKPRRPDPLAAKLFLTAEDLLALLREGFAPIVYRSQRLGAEWPNGPRRQLERLYIDAKIIRVKIDQRAITVAFLKNERKAEETLKLIESAKVKGDEIITYLMWLMMKNRGWAKSFGPHPRDEANQ